MRPTIKVGDRVRFRTDGEIGELNKVEVLTKMNNCYTVIAIHNGDLVGIMAEDRFVESRKYHVSRFDICNDFSQVQVGEYCKTSWCPLVRVIDVRQNYVSIEHIFSGALLAVKPECLTHINAKDVVLDFGAFKGTIESYGAHTILVSCVLGKDSYCCNTVRIHTLKPEMQTTVRQLLKRQEEKK
jgi:ethanolamine utilization cobalamin adenosyltransferase